jgi:hypothetical protein
MSGPTASTRGEIARMIALAETAGAGHLAGILPPDGQHPVMPAKGDLH